MLPKSLHVTWVSLMYLEIGPLRSVLKVVMSLGPDMIYSHVLVRRVDQWLARHRGAILSVYRKTTHKGERLPQKPSFPAPWAWTSGSRTLREQLSVVKPTESEVLGLTTLENLANPHFKCTFVNRSWWSLRLISVLWEMAWRSLAWPLSSQTTQIRCQFPNSRIVFKHWKSPDSQVFEDCYLKL